MKRAIAIRHLAFEDLGCFAEVLEQQGIELVYYDAPVDDLGEINADTGDLVVVLGGPISVNDTADYAFLEQELALLRRRLSLDRPTLGICLGAQLMARALGAEVMPGPVKEIGWAPITLSAAGEQSPLRHLAEDGVRVLHWHGETFELPVGAVRLASSELYQNQAFAWGGHCLALQFHGECTRAGLERWYVGHVGEIQQTAGLSVPGLRAQAASYAEDAVRHGKRFFSDWLSAISGQA